MRNLTIPIYKAERDAGLGERIATACSIAYHSPVLESPEALSNQVVVRSEVQATLGNAVTFDLYPVYTLMVSTGWNSNTDVFLKTETYTARRTPEDKPFNLGHNPRQIIGHITGNIVVNEALEVLDDNVSFDEVPDLFHIITSAVVYRHVSSRDKDLEKEAAQLIEEIQSGDWYVSMEALFTGFDYGIMYADGSQQLVERNSSTAFLTKHLRAYGGDGEYNGGRLGRVLRNITFSGKGLVKNPANPNSVIFNESPEIFDGVFATTLDISNDNLRKQGSDTHIFNKEDLTTDNQGELVMANENTNNDKYVEQLESQLTAANKKIEELGEVSVKAALAEKDAEVAQIKSELEKSVAKIEELTKLNEKVAELDGALATATQEKEDAVKKLDEATAKLAEIEEASRKTVRVATLVDKGVDKAEATQLVDDFVDLDDTKFEKLVELKATAKVSQTEEPKDPETQDTETANAADIDGAGDDDGAADPNLAVGGDEGSDSKNELMVSLAEFLDTSLHG